MRTRTSDLYFRAIEGRDIKALMAIDAASFAKPWQAKQFARALRRPEVHGRIAVADGAIAGFAVAELGCGNVHIARFAVAPEHRRSGVGRRMARWYVSRFVDGFDAWVTLHVRERNLIGQKFWASCGFKAIEVVRDFYVNPSEDAYLFAAYRDEECTGR